MVSDACIGSIIGMEKLTEVSLAGTRVSAEGFERLRSANPSLSVIK